MEIKVLHCSDIHLDASYPEIWGKGGLKRQEQREIFTRIIEWAGKERVDLVIIAGDLFTNRTVSISTVDFIKRQLKSIDPIPVFITPGNLDPYIPESPYCYTDWPPNVHIFNTNRFKAEEIPDKKIILYGAANKSDNDSYEALKNFSLRKKEGFHLITFHGSYSELPSDTAERDEIFGTSSEMNTCLPFDRADLERASVNYIALGHQHDRLCIRGDESGRPAWYCGAPEYLSFSDREEKGVLLCQISALKTQVSFIPLWKRKYVRIIVPCAGMKTEKDILQTIRKGTDEALSRAVVRVELGDTYSLPFDINIDSIEESLKDTFFGVKVHLFIETDTGLKNANSLQRLYREIMNERLSQSQLSERAYQEYALMLGIKALSF
ncbi:MAG: exonuclease SbcCD subunit D [Candidatus Xenobiia bacterium LiM19]